MSMKVIYVKSDTGVAYAKSNGTFGAVSAAWTTLTDAEKSVVLTSVEEGTATPAELLALEKFKVYAYTEGDCIAGIARPVDNGTEDWAVTEDDGGEEIYQPTCEIYALPEPQIVLPSGLLPFDGVSFLDKVEVESLCDSANKITVAVTSDLENYKTYDFTAAAWQDIDVASTEDMLENGIAAENLGNVPAAAWAELGTDGIGFAYCLQQTDYDLPCEVMKLSLTVSLIGRWDKAINGTDYRYGYIDHGGTSINVTFLKSGSYKINYTNADSTRETSSFQEPFGLSFAQEYSADQEFVYVDSRGDDLL